MTKEVRVKTAENVLNGNVRTCIRVTYSCLLADVFA